MFLLLSLSLLILVYYGIASVFLSSVSFIPYLRSNFMSVKSSGLVFYVQSISFDDRDLLYAYYFDLSKPQNTTSFRGWAPMKTSNLASRFSLSDFSVVPGLYSFGGRAVRQGSDMVLDISSLEFLGSQFDVKVCDGYLVLGVRKVTNYKTPDGKLLNGFKVFCIDCTLLPDENSIGYPLLEPFLDSTKIRPFIKECPAYYNLELTTVRGKNGKAVLKLVSGSFLESFAFPSKEVA